MIPNRSKPQLLAEWSELVNMTAAELEEFLAAPEGRVAGLTRTEAARQGIRSGQDSARAILRMKRKDPSEWSWQDWDWAQRQVAFIRRMAAMRGPLYDDAGRPTRKLLSLMLWGHLPVEASDEPATVRGGTAFASNRAAHPFRSVEVEREMLRRSSSESERARLRQHRYAVAGIDSRGRDWSLGTFTDLNDALRRAASQSRYPRAAVFDVTTGEMVH